MNARAWIVTGMLTATLAACGGDGADTSPNAAARPDACALVTKAEAEAALGTTATGPTTTQLSEGAQCSYDAGLSRVVVIVYNETVATGELTDETAPGEKVEGVGDAAYFYTNLGVVKVTKGDVSIGVGVLLNGAPSLEKSRSLAATATGRITA